MRDLPEVVEFEQFDDLPEADWTERRLPGRRLRARRIASGRGGETLTEAEARRIDRRLRRNFQDRAMLRLT
ncbi:hypothetical protein [Mesorhizobium sp. CN2-181]|uniref:hypothetical protein n=1 Tax=Mesorhizobium yinganensis TaxID=3157707 RepID=UPI0032B7A95E